MKNRRLHIDKVVSILRLKHESKRSNGEIAKLLSISKTAVKHYVRRSIDANICTWPLAERIDKFELERRLFPQKENSRKSKKIQFDYKEIHQIMKKKGATLKVLHAEYFELDNQFFSYSHFCKEYKKYKKTINLNKKRRSNYVN